MLFLIFGASGSGKTLALDALRERMLELAIHDFDEIGVPPLADIAWRHRADEAWARRALAYQAEGIDLVLAGQTPLGELLATPSAPLLDAISACLVDCEDEVRISRLRERGEDWFDRSVGDLQDHLHWAEWMRGHAQDPAWHPHVIRGAESASKMRWDGWSHWQAGDPRWRVQIMDTTGKPVDQVADELSAWIEGERELVRSGTHPLSGWATHSETGVTCGDAPGVGGRGATCAG
jgi:hypothetical protein